LKSKLTPDVLARIEEILGNDPLSARVERIFLQNLGGSILSDLIAAKIVPKGAAFAAEPG
jgi:hypothetical protein